jgi:prevent-host-death family protein
MVTVTLTDAKARLSALVKQAAQGETVVITRRGKPVARITTIDRPRKPIDIAALGRLTEGMSGQPVASGE